jgi:hypothetical protein
VLETWHFGRRVHFKRPSSSLHTKLLIAGRSE